MAVGTLHFTKPNVALGIDDSTFECSSEVLDTCIARLEACEVLGQPFLHMINA